MLYNAEIGQSILFRKYKYTSVPSKCPHFMDSCTMFDVQTFIGYCSRLSVQFFSRYVFSSTCYGENIFQLLNLRDTTTGGYSLFFLRTCVYTYMGLKKNSKNLSPQITPHNPRTRDHGSWIMASH